MNPKLSFMRWKPWVCQLHCKVHCKQDIYLQSSLNLVTMHASFWNLHLGFLFSPHSHGTNLIWKVQLKELDLEQIKGEQLGVYNLN